MPQNKSGGYNVTLVRNRIEELRRATDFADDALEPVLIEVLDLLEEVKVAKKAIKDGRAKLQADTKKRIETITDEEAKQLLRIKWVRDLLDDIRAIPEQAITELIERVDHLGNKYATTLSDIGKRGNDAQNKLATMMGQLTGPDRDMEGIQELAAILGGEQ